MLRLFPAAIWTVILYGLTIATSGLPIGPTLQPQATSYEIQKSVWWFEFNHAVLHAATFAVLAALLVVAHGHGEVDEVMQDLGADHVVEQRAESRAEQVAGVLPGRLRPGGCCLPSGGQLTHRPCLQSCTGQPHQSWHSAVVPSGWLRGT